MGKVKQYEEGFKRQIVKHIFTMIEDTLIIQIIVMSS